MGRPGYMSLYADERTQQIFDDFVRVKGITKSTALSEMLEIYMLCQDERLYLELKKKTLGVETAKQALLERTDVKAINDYIFMKLGASSDREGNILDGMDTMEAYRRNCEKNGYGYTWFSTESLHFGMAKKKVRYYNSLAESGEEVTILFAVGEEVNDIKYSAKVLSIASSRDSLPCPGEEGSIPEEFGGEDEAKIWIQITDIREENELKAAMFNVRSTDANLKQVISNSQFHFGYVYIPKKIE
ncbi:MAG: hypothetical protein HFI17_02500 [Lachnospiraceae bacterium]|jgi:hypothetical protein|nr:hypothetical protein [Lachnospiraceae bacterium]